MKQFFSMRKSERIVLPELISKFYTDGVGLLSASLFIPTIAGLWWKKANRTGGIASILTGASVYGITVSGIFNQGVAPIIVALPASALAMIIGGVFGAPEKAAMISEIEKLH